jgi:hypothetical protein
MQPAPPASRGQVLTASTDPAAAQHAPATAATRAAARLTGRSGLAGFPGASAAQDGPARRPPRQPGW